MSKKREAWEDELWSYINASNGIGCPQFDSCTLKSNKDIRCFNDESERETVSLINNFVDNDDIDVIDDIQFDMQPRCLLRGRVFELVTKLTQKYLSNNWNNALPVSNNLIIEDRHNHPIEVCYLYLKANHGAVWRLPDSWMIYINKRDTPARQRFTLYHEVFHILAHSHGKAVFKKTRDAYVYFNEVLADHFAANILMPCEVLKQKWASIGDIGQISDLFDVPKPVMYIALASKGLI